MTGRFNSVLPGCRSELRSKVQEGSFRSQKTCFWGAWFMFSVWAHALVACSQIFSHHILWKCEKYHSAISIIRAECTVWKDTLETLKTICFKQRGSCALLKRDGDQPFTDERCHSFFYWSTCRRKWTFTVFLFLLIPWIALFPALFLTLGSSALQVNYFLWFGYFCILRWVFFFALLLFSS